MLTPNCTLTKFFTTTAATIDDIYNYKWNISVVKNTFNFKTKMRHILRTYNDDGLF